MGWFDEQLRQRNHIDQEEFEESMLQMAASLIGKRETVLDDPDELTLDAVNEILKYYKLKPVEVPDSLESADEQMQYCLHKYGLMKRRVELRDKWWRDSTGPLILYKKDSDIPVVARPRSFGGYEIIEGGIKKKVNAKVFAEYKTRALCFYRPLPSRSLNVKDLITYMKNCLQKSDYVFVILLTLVVALVGMLLPKIARMLTSVVYESGSMSLLIATAEYILAVLISSALFSMLNSLMLARLSSKTSLNVEAAVMMRDGEYERTDTYLQECRERYAGADLTELDRALASLNRAIGEPESGAVLAGTKGEYGTVTVRAGDSPALVKIVSLSDPKNALTFYVRAGETAAVHVKDGNYTLRYATGDKWYGADELFGAATRFYSVDTVLRFSTDRVGGDIFSQNYRVEISASSDGAISAVPTEADRF